MDTRNGARKAYWDRRFARSPKGPSPSELVDAEGIAMHTIVTNVPAEERERRMASPDPGEHRISYGCINFPPSFFADVVAPALARRGSVVHVLPDTRSLADVFASLKAKAQNESGAPMHAADRKG